MRRKILVLPSWYPSSISRVRGIFIQEQAQVLSSMYDVAVLFNQILSIRDLFKLKALKESYIQDIDSIIVKQEKILAPSRTPYRLRAYLYTYLAERGFRKLLSTWGRPDLIHAHVVFPGGWGAVYLGRKFGIPVVLTEHSGPFSVHLKKGNRIRLTREVLARADRVIAVSPALLEQIQAFDKSISIDVVGNVIRTEFFKPSMEIIQEKESSGSRFLSIALLNEEKGIHYLLEAAHILIRRGLLSFELIIGGDGPIRPDLEEMAKTLGLAENCSFIGMLSQGEVRYRMQQCDVFVLPSLGETFGMVIGEAMACGKPVISTRCGGPEFVVTPETGVLVDPANPIALANAMERFIHKQVNFSPQVIRQSILQRFGENAFLESISTIYEQVLDKSR